MQLKRFSCVALLILATTGTFSRAESVTAQENLEKLKKTNSCRGCDLSGLDLTRLNLSGADLEGADCSKTKFHLTNLSGANLKGANLRGASFGGTDLGEADLRGADLRGTSLEGAYLDKTQLDGEFITAKPYEEIGVTDLEKQVYVPNPEKPKKSPETRDANVAARRDAEPAPAPPPTAAEKETAAANASTAKDPQPQVPAAKKAVPVAQAMVEPQESAGKAAKGNNSASIPAIAKDENAGSVPGKKPPLPSEGGVKKAGDTRKSLPVPPAEVKIDGVKAGTTQDKTTKGVGGTGKAGAEGIVDSGKNTRLARLLSEEKCFGCDLSGLDLSGKNLKNVDLEQANLTDCNLERAILDSANLKGALLQDASLRMASLKNADLYKADLSGADLSGANVEGAKLDSAKLVTAVGLETAIK